MLDKTAKAVACALLDGWIKRPGNGPLVEQDNALGPAVVPVICSAPFLLVSTCAKPKGKSHAV